MCIRDRVSTQSTWEPPPSKPQHPPAKKANPPSSDPPKSPQIPPSTIPRYTKLPGHVTKSSPEYEKIMAEALKKAEYAQNEIFFKNKAPARQFILEAIAAIKKLAEQNSSQPIQSDPVSYTHLTLPTILLVQISVVAVSLKKKIKQ
eukprot:TRINITY_DN11117_c0_g1_i3.p2 TRINITY_DN11117_c0_g1~~TRINITY_DN11117_c0_g1_i3.p2  ORF type:complete len:146 (+),score=44.49 TRINITY_DN11117_c0_g1_i3:126-563(+)